MERSVSRRSSELQRLFQLSYGSLLHLDLFTGEALTGLEAERSVSRSPGEARVGGGKIRLGDFLFPGDAHRVGGGKIRLGDFLLGWRRKDPSRGFLAPRRGRRVKDPSLGDDPCRVESSPRLRASELQPLPIELWILATLGFIHRRGARLVGGGKIRLGDFLFPEKALTGLEVERSVSGISCSQERRSPGWRRKDPSRRFLAPRRGAHRVGGGKIRLGDFSQERRSPVAERSVLERRSLGWRWDPSRVRHSPEIMIRAWVELSPRSASFRAAEPLPIELWTLTSQARRLLSQRASPAYQVAEHVRHRAVERLESEPSQC